MADIKTDTPSEAQAAVTGEPATPAVALAEPSLESPVESPVTIPVAAAAPLVKNEPAADASRGASPAASPELLGLPLQFLNQLLQKLGATQLQSLADLLPAGRILLLAVLAGIALRLTSATLGAINDIPLVGGLLELVGLVALLNFLARNAFKQQKRAELLDRIRRLRKDLLS